MSFESAALPDHLEDPQEAGPAPRSGPLRFARMAGSSIAGRDAAPWITDFLNAAYYRCPPGRRDVDDLRLAFCILTTAWYRKPAGQKLRLTDLAAFHRAFGADRFDTSTSGRGVLDREQLLAGAARLLGPWFPAAYADDARRAWGIAFPTVAEREALRPRTPHGAGLPRVPDARARAARRAGVAHLPARRDAVRRGRRERPDAPRRPGRTTRARSAASRRCARAGCSGRRSRSRSPPAPAPACRSSRAAT
jgi:hypothetical protein